MLVSKRQAKDRHVRFTTLDGSPGASFPQRTCGMLLILGEVPIGLPKIENVAFEKAA